MKSRYLSPILFVFALLAGCAQPPADSTPQETGGSDGYDLQWLSGLAPDTILVQLDFEPTFSRMEAMFPFGRTPYFTLYADGTVVYIDAGETYAQQQIFAARLSPDQTLAFVEEFMGMGFAGLEDYLDFCSPPNESGTQECIADDSFTVIRATMADGAFRSVKSYGNFSNDPAALQGIRLLLTSFSSADGAPYSPERAALFVTGMPTTLDRYEFAWPLAPEYLEAGMGATRAYVLNGGDLQRLIEAVGRNTGDFYFENNGAGYLVYLVSWLPSDDYSAELAEAFPMHEIGQTPSPIPEPIFAIEAAAKADLAEKLGMDVEAITVYQVEEVDWPDGCLGIRIEDTACTDAIVHGLRLLLDAAGVSYEYRATMDGSLVLSASDQLAGGRPESIVIATPGAGSRVVSPLVVEGVADPTFEQTIVVRILLADGTMIAQEPTTIQADIGQRGTYRTEIAYEISGEQPGFVQVYATSARDGGITHLNSVGVMLASGGEAEILPPAGGDERISISLPIPGETIRSGVVHVEGFALAGFEQTLVVDILDEDGEVLASMPVIVQAPDLGLPGPFSADILLTIRAEGAGRIVVRDPSPAFEGDVHISSVEVRLAP